MSLSDRDLELIQERDFLISQASRVLKDLIEIRAPLSIIKNQFLLISSISINCLIDLEFRGKDDIKGFLEPSDN